MRRLMQKQRACVTCFCELPKYSGGATCKTMTALSQVFSPRIPNLSLFQVAASTFPYQSGRLILFRSHGL